jgi:CDP-paratose 2-epimerase
MSAAIVTGSGGLIGAEAARFLVAQGLDVIGIDNDMRSHFFGPSASTRQSWTALKRLKRYTHVETDIRGADAIELLFKSHAAAIALVIHTAAQPSHDWAAREPITDFSINAAATLGLLEATRRYCPRAVFIFCMATRPTVCHWSSWKIAGSSLSRTPLRRTASTNR